MKVAGERVPPVEFFSPLALLAVGLFAANDHFLKSAFHNDVTGKLSDIAVCFFLPLYVSALLGLVLRMRPTVRLAIGAIVAAVVFTAQELSDTAGGWLHLVLSTVGPPFGIHGLRLTRDPTDLFALVLVPVAVWYGLRRTRLAVPGEAAR